MFVSAEDIYRYFNGSAAARTRDFSPALLEFCRGFELLLNSRLGKLCDAIRSLISGNPQLQDFVKQELAWANFDDALRFKKSYSIPQVASTLRLGKVVEQRYPELLGKDTAAHLAASGLADHDSVIVLSHIGLIFRNGKVHPYPGSGHMFTSPQEVQLLRKLLFGLDEEHVDSDTFFSEFFKLLSFTQAEKTEAIDSLTRTWVQFPGLVPRFWRGSNVAAAA